jgi:hypothetical protein
MMMLDSDVIEQTGLGEYHIQWQNDISRSRMTTIAASPYPWP